jgi:hypothetical protein
MSSPRNASSSQCGEEAQWNCRSPIDLARRLELSNAGHRPFPGTCVLDIVVVTWACCADSPKSSINDRAAGERHLTKQHEVQKRLQFLV